VKICFLPSDPDGPGSYRCFFPMEQLAKHGHDARLPPHTIDHGREVGQIGLFEYKIAWNPIMPNADLFVLQLPQQSIYPRFTVAARLGGKIVVGEVDDDYVNLSPDHPAYLATKKHPHFNRLWMLNTFRACDAITVTTPQLKRVYSEINPNVHVLPNALNWEMWKDVTPQYEIERKRVRIGWMGDSYWRPRDVSLLAECVGPFLSDHPEVDFVAAGNNEDVFEKLGVPEQRRVSYQGVPFRARPDLTDLSGLPTITATMDIGLVPLVLSDFNQAKSCLKGMEYAACGIPCVASPTEPYREWVEHGVNGFLARTPAEWRQALEALLDSETRRRMGEAARAKAKRHTIQKRWKEWANLYLSLRHSRVPYIPGDFSRRTLPASSSGSAASSAVAA
jgi:glycosyltransferase involved in cell wall biosynthesis